MTKGKRIFNWICMAVTVAAMIMIIIKTDINQLMTALSNLNYIWLAAAVAVVVMSWIFDSLIFQRMMPGITGKRTSFIRSFKYSMIGFYYMALSPFGSAGQPMQMVHMGNDGISVGKSTAAATLKFFTDKISVAMMLSVFFFISGAAFYKNHMGIFWFSLLAFAMNMVILTGVFMLIVKPAFAERLFKGIIRFFSRLGIIKNPENSLSKIDIAIKDYSSAAFFIRENKIRTIVLSVFSLVRRMLWISVPYFLYRAFGLNAAGIMEVLSLNVFMSFAITLMPTPGGSLAAEGGFSAIFSGMFGSAIIPAVITWRLLTYYLVIAAGALTLSVHTISKGLAKRKTVPESSDYVLELSK